MKRRIPPEVEWQIIKEEIQAQVLQGWSVTRALGVLKFNNKHHLYRFYQTDLEFKGWRQQFYKTTKRFDHGRSAEVQDNTSDC